MIERRPIAWRGVERLGACDFKIYAMSVPGFVPPEPLLAAARPATAAFARSSPGSAAGFLLLHRARPACFVLAHVWDGVDLIQQYWTSSHDRPHRLRPHRANAIGCLWELEVISFERDQWAATYGEPADVESYLGRHL